jgi:stage II sporulation protein D
VWVDAFWISEDERDLSPPRAFEPGMRRIATTAAVVALLAAVLAPNAGAATRWSLKGAGWGHGIGMSQWGANGYAAHGADHRTILRHYYKGTAIAKRESDIVRVLLAPNRSKLSFRGAGTVDGLELDPGETYEATRSGATVVLRNAKGDVLKRATEIATVTGSPRVRLLGTAANGVRDGIYRGTLEIRTAVGTGLNAVNALELESYVRGVVPNESPSSWPAAALEAQAVAARTYAITTDAGGRGFDQYADTRSQVYRGYLSETPTTGAAVDSTRGEIVTYGGKAVVTYFFSTSGGYTEDIENVFVGAPAEPWLQGVEDPYDNSSPYHRWGPYSFSRRALSAKLGSWVRGRFKGIKVLERGVSPRVVRATVRGSRGSTVVTGPQLRTRLGLRDSWFYVKRVSTKAKRGLRARTVRSSRAVAAITGSVSAARERFVTLQRQDGDKWVKVVDVPLERDGRYSIHVGEAGVYRVLAGWAPGPALHVEP